MKQVETNHTPSPALLKFTGDYERLCARQEAATENEDGYLLTLVAMYRTRATLLSEAWDRCAALNEEVNRHCPPSEVLRIQPSDSQFENFFPYSERSNEDRYHPGFYDNSAIDRLASVRGFRSEEAQTRERELVEAVSAQREARRKAYESTGYNAQEEIANAHHDSVSAIEAEIEETPAHTIGGLMAKLEVIRFWAGTEGHYEAMRKSGSCSDMAVSIAADLLRLMPAEN